MTSRLVGGIDLAILVRRTNGDEKKHVDDGLNEVGIMKNIKMCDTCFRSTVSAGDELVGGESTMISGSVPNRSSITG